jgi:hypothetical protein
VTERLGYSGRVMGPPGDADERRAIIIERKPREFCDPTE